MGGAYAALLGAIVGGLFTLAGGLFVEIRRDGRRQIGGARLVASQLQRSGIEFAIAKDEPAEADWFEGPHRDVRTDAWQEHAADFIGRLTAEQFQRLDQLHSRLASAGEFGFTRNEAANLDSSIDQPAPIIERLAEATRFDRLVWRL